MPKVSQSLLFRILEYSDYHSYSLESLMEEPKLSIEVYSNETCYISRDTLGRLWEKAVEVSQNPLLGYELQNVVDICEFGLLGRLVKYAPTLGQSFEAVSKYSTLINNDTYIDVIRGREFAYIKISLANNLFTQYPTMARQKSLWALGLLLKSFTKLTGKEIEIRKITMPLDYRTSLEKYHLASEMEYHDSNITIVKVESEVLDYNNVHKSQIHFALLVKMANDLIDKNYTLAEKIAQFYLTEDLTKFPSIDDVANYLDTSPRSIQRTLSEKNLSFQEIQIKSKMKRALKYLENYKSVKETAYLVGYAESSSFSKAFKKFYGYSPVKVRLNYKENGNEL